MPHGTPNRRLLDWVAFPSSCVTTELKPSDGIRYVIGKKVPFTPPETLSRRAARSRLMPDCAERFSVTTDCRAAPASTAVSKDGFPGTPPVLSPEAEVAATTTSPFEFPIAVPVSVEQIAPAMPLPLLLTAR